MNKLIPACLIALLPLVAGCTTTAPQEHFYVLAAPGPTAVRTIPFDVAVRPFAVADAYATDQMAYRRGPVRIGYYHYHRWAATPDELVREALIAGLRAAELFEHVTEYSARQNAALILSGKIRRIEEIDKQAHWEAHLALDVSLRKSSSGQIVYTRSFDLYQQTARRNPDAVAKAMSRLIERVVDAIVEDVQSLEPSDL